nr:hypothetical protein [Tanacetum cinerariifolium]
AFLGTTDVLEIYMQELWATDTVHHHSIRFKMDNKKRIVSLKYFREMMHICPRLPGQTFDDLPFEEEIMAFLGHSREIRKLTDVNINKLHQPWRSFAAIINKPLSRKSTGYDSLRVLVFVGESRERSWEVGRVVEKEQEVGMRVWLFHASCFFLIWSGFVLILSDVNINLEGRDVQMTYVHTTREFKDTHVTLNPVNPDGQQQLASLTLSAPTLTPSTIPTISTVPQAPTPPTTTLSTLLQDLPNFGSLFGFDHRLKTLEANFSEFVQNNQFTGAFDRLRDEAQAENEEFLKNLDENIQKIIKEQVKEQVKVQVSKILPKIKKIVNEQLEAKVLTRSSNSSKTSYAVAADLSEMELKKIPIEKMESNKSIHRSDEQRNLDKALVEAFKSDKIILDTYGDIVTLKRRRDDDADKDEEPSARSDRGSKRRREGNEPESTSTPKEKATRTTGKSTQGSKSQQKTASESAPAEKPIQTNHDLEEPSHQEFETGAVDDQPIAEASQHPEWFQQQKKPPTPDQEVYKATTDQLNWNNPKGQQYPHNLLKPLPLIPNSRGCRVIPFDHFINNDLEYLRGGASSRKYTNFVTKTKATEYGHIKWIEDLVPRTMWSQEPISYDKHALIIAVTELKIVEWHNYKHLDCITVHRDDDKLYKFKEGDFKRLRI